MTDKNIKNILVFAMQFRPFRGGAEVATEKIIERVADCHFDIVTGRFTRNLPAKEVGDDFVIYRVGIGNKWIDKYLYPIFAFMKAVQLKRVNDYVFMWSIMATWAGIASLVTKVFYPHFKYLLTMQSGDSDSFIQKRTWFWSGVYSRVYKRADHIQVISKWLEERARQFGYKGEISIVSNGVDTERFAREKYKKEREEIRSNYNIGDDDVLVFTASRLVEKNNIEGLIKSLEFLSPKFRLMIAGDGKKKDELVFLVKKLDLVDRVIWLGNIDYDNLPEFYSSADIFARVPYSEGFGNSFVEAYAMELPVVASAVGGINDFLVDGETGIVTDPKDARDIARAIERVADDQNLHDKIVENGCKLVKEKYDWSMVAKKMQDVFEGLYQK